MTSFVPTETEFLRALVALFLIVGVAVAFGALAAWFTYLGDRADAAIRRHR